MKEVPEISTANSAREKGKKGGRLAERIGEIMLDNLS
jgi:hypothetical protein